MEIILVSPEKLKIILTRQDMNNLSLEYEDMDYTDLQTKEVIVSLLEQAKEQAGFNPKNTKLFIEVYPTQEGGCVLYFTSHSSGSWYGGPKKGYQVGPIIFEFEDSETLIQAAIRLFSRYSHRIYKSSLYLYGQRYRLILYPLDYSDRLSVFFLGEYAKRVGEGEILAAFIQEHGKELAVDNAIDLLARYFSQ
ncbi:adaptor protein MecA [Oscillospiraceae bacterium MB08-C2-2]|nr:adaptor protein MecA [Oscillospiraceae bacterium MB08-C2-2]